MSKIVGISNYDLDTVNDILIAENVNIFYAPRIVDFLNLKYCERYFFCIKDDNYVLHRWIP